MKKRLLVGGLIAVAVALSLLASSNASAASGLFARGDSQVSGRMVQVWVVNSSSRAQFASVTVVALDQAGHYLQSFGRAFVPGHSVRPVRVLFSAPVRSVSRTIVTPAG